MTTRAFLRHTQANRIDTEYLQQSLRSLGYHPGPADGRFGISTLRAVVAFQRAANVLDSGMVNPETWAALEATLHPPTKKATTAASKSKPVAKKPTVKKPAGKKPTAKKQ